MNLLKNLEQYNPLISILCSTAEKAGIEIYAVGGFVRDILLERPSKDIDILCLGDSALLAEKVAEAADKKEPPVIYGHFGTAMVRLEGYDIEFVTARKESYRPESRNPEVSPGTLEDDLLRRDFTVNALAVSLNKDDYGELIDLFGGLADLRRKIIRTPTDPKVTFFDDPLRIMRAIRFASQLNFDIAPDTFHVLSEHRERLGIISRERISDELNKIIMSPKPSYGFKLLFAAGILEIVFPELPALQGTETVNDKSHKDNFYHTLQVLDNVAAVSNNLWLRWAALLHDIAKPATKRFDPKVGWTFHGHEERGARMVPKIFQRLKLPLNEKMRYVQKLVRLHLRPIALVKETVTDSAIRRLLFEAGDDTDDLMVLCRADITSKNEARVKRYLANFDKVERRMKEVEESDKLRNFQPVITGAVIMDTFGLKPSPVIGSIKEELKEAVLEGKVKNEYEPCFRYMLAIAHKYGLKEKS